MGFSDFCKFESCKLISIVLVSFLIFILILTSDVSGFLKGVLSISLLLVTGMIIRSVTRADGWSGFIMFNIKEGLDFINWMNKIFGRWMDQISDFGLVFGFGLASIKLFRHIQIKTVILSLAILLLFTFFISPYITVIAFTAIQIPQTDSIQSSGQESIAIASLLVLLLFGFTGLVSLSLIAKAATIVYSVLLFIFKLSPKIDSTPGVSFIIPGITIPLFEGVIALLVLLVLHEGAHGIEALRSRIKLKSSGLLLFGFIPVGAYVDIDEKSLSNKDKKHRLRVAAAGAATNILASILFFIPTFLLLISMNQFYSDRLSIIGFSKNLQSLNISIGSELYSINGVQISSLDDFNLAKKSFQPDSNVILETSQGVFTVKTDSNGMIGILVSPAIKKDYWWIKSLYLTLALLTVLNFFVGVINLLPVQAFDGHRILQDSIKNKQIVTLISYIILASLILNIVPWAWS